MGCWAGWDACFFFLLFLLLVLDVPVKVIDPWPPLASNEKALFMLMAINWN